MTIYQCNVEGCTNFTIDNRSLGCAEHGQTLEKVEEVDDK